MAIRVALYYNRTQTRHKGESRRVGLLRNCDKIGRISTPRPRRKETRSGLPGNFSSGCRADALRQSTAASINSGTIASPRTLVAPKKQRTTRDKGIRSGARTVLPRDRTPKPHAALITPQRCAVSIYVRNRVTGQADDGMRKD